MHTAELDEDYSKDVYRWAVLFENQRGCVFLQACLDLSDVYYVGQSHFLLHTILFASFLVTDRSSRVHATVSL